MTTTAGLNIVGVQFRRAGRIYDFTSGANDLKVGDDVVVDTERGPSLAKVAVIRFEDSGPGREHRENKDLKPIIRAATRRDMDETLKLTPEHATKFARDRVEKLELKMSVLQSEVQFGGNKVIVFFAAPGRVDFRELVKELASGLRARVELKQVGARDEAKLVGGLGICGREFCCSSFLREFVPVSIKMAKNQNLALNPSKVSGGCGRLLCCLTYENDQYTEMRRQLPPRGTRVHCPDEGVTGDVIKGDILNQLVVIETSEGRQVTVKVAKLEIVEGRRGAADESEADSWGEDIDLDALSQLDDSHGDKGGSDRGRRPPAARGAPPRAERPRPERSGPPGANPPSGPSSNTPASGQPPGNGPRPDRGSGPRRDDRKGGKGPK